MRIIISPAKKMRVDTDTLDYYQLPQFVENTEILLAYLKRLSYEKLKSIWKCSDKIATLNYDRIQKIDLYSNLTPAILSFEGIQYQYMGSEVFDINEFEYLQTHLRIFSGFYGMLRPFDGVVPYRLEMQSKLRGKELNSLYEFWDRSLADSLFSESNCIINLASKEYSRCISNYLDKSIRFITCIFGEMIKGKIVEKGTLVKMARGEMVRFMAENQIKDIEEIKTFNRLNYTFRDKLSDENTYVFLKKKNN
ncbi:peroxide stress protein YaaA [Sporosalibacterium faouarense]|uniref:peroxide stress protein YaaA n=1 Tax=Sporosalibacterium faouarense TaxID=516123 RepID=UPI00141C2993|nr:peroxide stress protein YaaA [Sporosalibacterium faouarense]MTI47173.1 peroxide stress protein YaaA [Bacillota bacterium]